MITGFENITNELTRYETDVLVPAMVKGLQTKIGEHNTITATKAIALMKSKNYKISGARFRKVVNHIRINGLIENLVSTSKGYYIATDHSQVERYMESLGQRIRAITLVYDSMEHQSKKLRPAVGVPTEAIPRDHPKEPADSNKTMNSQSTNQ